MAEQEAHPADSPIPLDPRSSHTLTIMVLLLMKVKTVTDTEIQLTAAPLISSPLSKKTAAVGVVLKEAWLKTQVTHFPLL